MESAALLLITSSMSVMFGWQPMPDADSMEGGQKIEYIVQIEPELVATLKEGQSIPITSDIPDDIGPIGRIRIVVGREDLPKQNLVTRFKPWPKKRSLEKTQSLGKTTGRGLVETQFTVPSVKSSGSGRYANQTASNNQILPPGGNSEGNSAAANPLGRALQQGAQEVRDLAADVNQQILPPADQLFGQGGTGSQGVQNAIDNTTNQLRRGLQQGVEQVADRAGQQLRDTVDKFGRSLTPERSILSGEQNQNLNTILPPSSQTNNGLSAPKGRRIDLPLQPQRPQSQPQSQPQQHLHNEPPANFADSRGDTNPRNRPDTFNTPRSSINNNPPPPATPAHNTPPPTRYNNQNNQPPTGNSQWPNRPSGRDAFDLVNRQKENTPQHYPNNRQPRLSASSNGTEGPQFPDAGFSGTGSQPSSHHSDSTRWNNHPATPEIRRDMFEEPIGQEPVDRGIQTAGNTQGNQEQTTTRSPLGSRPLGAQPRDFDWNQNSANTSYNSLANENTGPNSSKSLFPLVLSWVLLSGSVIGNVYLFTSYLDVRNKYQGVVHGNSGRRGRYDD